MESNLQTIYYDYYDYKTLPGLILENYATLQQKFNLSLAFLFIPLNVGMIFGLQECFKFF